MHRTYLPWGWSVAVIGAVVVCLILAWWIACLSDKNR